MALARPVEENVFVGEDDQYHEPSSFGRFWTKWGDMMLGGTAVILFLAFWEWAGTSGAINPLFTSSPSRIINAFVKLSASGELLNDIRVSSLEFLYGFGLAIIVGIPFGILMGWYRLVEAV